MEYWRVEGGQQTMPAEFSPSADAGSELPRLALYLALPACWLWRQATDERERWVLWIPAFIGVGIGIYFGLNSEPPVWLGAAGLAIAVSLRVAFRSWPLPAAAATCLALVCLGLAAVQLRVALVSAPMLSREIGSVAVEGRVCEADLQPHGYRLYLDDVTIAGVPLEATPARVRLRVGAGFSPDRMGERIDVAARLGPISAPVAPGALTSKGTSTSSALERLGSHSVRRRRYRRKRMTVGFARCRARCPRCA